MKKNNNFFKPCYYCRSSGKCNDYKNSIIGKLKFLFFVTHNERWTKDVQINNST